MTIYSLENDVQGLSMEDSTWSENRCAHLPSLANLSEMLWPHVVLRQGITLVTNRGLRLAVRRYAAPRRGGAVDRGWDGRRTTRRWLCYVLAAGSYSPCTANATRGSHNLCCPEFESKKISTGSMIESSLIHDVFMVTGHKAVQFEETDEIRGGLQASWSRCVKIV